MSGPLFILALIGLVVAFYKFPWLRVQAQNAWGAMRAQPAAQQANPPGQRPSFAWAIILIVLAIAVIFWGGLLQSNPSSLSFTSVNAWVWRGHGPALIALVLIAAVLIAIYGGANRGILWNILGWTVGLLFLGFALLSLFEPSPQTAAARASQGVVVVAVKPLCPEMSMSEVRSCDITADEWTPWVRLESGARDTAHKVCASYGVKSERTDEGGATKFRYRANSGTDKVKYRIVPLETDCVIAGF